LKKNHIEMAAKMDQRGSQQKSLDMQINEMNGQFERMVKEKEEYHRKVLLDLYAERDRIIAKRELYEEERNNQLKAKTNQFETRLVETEHKYGNEKKKITQQSQQAMFNLKTDQMNFQEALRQAEEDYNEDLNMTVDKLESRLQKIKLEGEKLRSKNSKLSKENEKNEERKRKLDDLIKETADQNEKLKAEIREFREKCDDMQNQLNEQEKIINVKEGMIKEFRNMNYHLQNYKSVYDYQVNTLKEEHEPLSEYVDNLEVIGVF